MKKIILSAFITLAGVINLNAQTLTITGSITTQPCTNDGVYAVSVVGLTTPITYTYYTGGGTFVHSNVNSSSDQLTNFSAYDPSYIYCIATDGTNYAYGQYSYYALPFHVNISSSPAICPALLGTLSASTFSGTPGPFTFNWTNTNTGLHYLGNNISAPVGTYSLLVTDQITGCLVQVSDSSTSVVQVSNINLNYTSTIAYCTDGTASVTASGGTPPYNYSWNNGANTTSINNLIRGRYTATVTDVNGCTNNTSWGIYVSQAINVYANTTSTNATCIQNNGSAMAFEYK